MASVSARPHSNEHSYSCTEIREHRAVEQPLSQTVTGSATVLLSTSTFKCDLKELMLPIGVT